MRNHLINRISRNAEKDDRIMLVTGDLGFSVLENFAEKFPGRYINAGIAEQNMTAVAAGLALEGNKVFTYSIGNFPTLRCMEQLRNDVCYHNADVKVVAVGGGFAYGALGMTHHATEELAMLRALPNMKIYVPCDSVSAEKIADLVCKQNGPAYIRLERGKEPAIFDENRDLNPEKIQCLRKGENIAIFCIGTIVAEALKAAEKYNASVYSVLSLKPFDTESVCKIALENKAIITVEEHNIIGGLGSAVSETLTDNAISCRLERLGLKEQFTSEVGNQQYLRECYGVDAESIAKHIEELLK